MKFKFILLKNILRGPDLARGPHLAHQWFPTEF